MATNRSAQVELDKEIARLANDLLQLKRRRNALSPISQLPTEVLSRILYQVLDPTKPQKRTPDFVPLCHVSATWRATVLSTPEIWTTLRLARVLRSKMAILMWKNSCEFITDLEYEGPGGDICDKDTAPCFPWILKCAMPKLRRVALYGSARQLGGLIPRMSGSYEALQELKIVHEGPRWGNLTKKLAIQRVPNLRRLELIGAGIERWSFQQLQPTALTHLVLGNLKCGPEEHMFNVLDFIAEAPQLSTLHVMFRTPEEDWEDHAYPTRNQSIALPSLKSFELGCGNITLLNLYMKTLSIPEPTALSRIKIECYGAIAPKHTEDLLSSWRNMHASTGDLVSPQQLTITEGDILDIWREPTTPAIGASMKSTSSSCSKDSQITPWVSCEGFPLLGLVRGTDLTTRQMWSLDNLVVLDNHSRFTSCAEWGLFSSLPNIQAIHLFCSGLSGHWNRMRYPSCSTFLQALRGELGRDGRSDDTDEVAGKLRRLQDNPFPALCAIVFGAAANLLDDKTELSQEFIMSLQTWNANRAIRDGKPGFKLPIFELRMDTTLYGKFEEQLQEYRASFSSVAQMVLPA
ncbi:hypothetical protein D9611_007489 [Ephemerocybe angulata]|uniref:F-box domain-containing protein n=1 Tax=Ephemerocybe angulata TaxID=980116 RepID=A0A8H5CF49_9AGAR|nr:hypothetical protein D9611_007489 [Tulosesus angulatus]